MRIWIDATHPNSLGPFFGMTVLEYQLRVILETERQIKQLSLSEEAFDRYAQATEAFDRLIVSQVRPAEVRIELPEGAEDPGLPEDLRRRLPIRFARGSETPARRLRSYVAEAAGEPVIALAGDSIIDVRVLEEFVWGRSSRAYVSGEGTKRTAMLRLDASPPQAAGPETELADVATTALSSATPVERLDEEKLGTWIPKLRRSLPPFLYRIDSDATRAEVEYKLFRSNYKGATDFLTAYVFPPLVWILTRRFARTSITPNQVTVVGIIACFAAIPFFAAGMWIPGLVLGYLMAVLDSVDGKLARLTFTYTNQGDILDHGLDLVHPPLWYFAWAWGLSGGELQSPLVTASIWWFLFYMFDRVMEMLFKASTGQSIHGYTPLDVRMRTFISRRNTNMAVFTLALLLGLGVESFYFMAAWQGACLAFHLSRVITYWNVDDPKASGA